jgi:predicted aspartyl protease
LDDSDWAQCGLSFWFPKPEKELMIHGVVNFRYELTLPIVVGNSNRQREFVNTVINTGFDGFLSLPSELIVRLGLSWRTSNITTLGDGSQTLFDFYTGTVIWNGR